MRARGWIAAMAAVFVVVSLLHVFNSAHTLDKWLAIAWATIAFFLAMWPGE